LDSIDRTIIPLYLSEESPKETKTQKKKQKKKRREKKRKENGRENEAYHPFTSTLH
jgi:hypothetical protein